MLGSARLQTLVWTAEKTRAQAFYSDVLGLPLTAESHGALVYAVGGGELRVSPVPATTPSEHTGFGFAVEDIEAELETLVARGVVPERFPGFPHDARGGWGGPNGEHIFFFL